MTYSFVIVASGDVVCYTVYPLTQIVLLANVHCNELLVWFKASGFWYTIKTGLSPKLLSDTQLLLQIIETLGLWFFRTCVMNDFEGGFVVLFYFAFEIGCHYAMKRFQAGLEFSILPL